MVGRETWQETAKEEVSEKRMTPVGLRAPAIIGAGDRPKKLKLKSHP